MFLNLKSTFDANNKVKKGKMQEVKELLVFYYFSLYYQHILIQYPEILHSDLVLIFISYHP